jgi:hypothetical protein
MLKVCRNPCRKILQTCSMIMQRIWPIQLATFTNVKLYFFYMSQIFNLKKEAKGFWNHSYLPGAARARASLILIRMDRLTNNVPVVIWRGTLEGVGPENRYFFGPWNCIVRSEWNFMHQIFCILLSLFCILYSVFCILFLCSVFCIPRVNQRWHSQLFAKKISSNNDQGVLNSAFWSWNDQIFLKISNILNSIVSLRRLHETDRKTTDFHGF